VDVGIERIDILFAVGEQEDVFGIGLPGRASRASLAASMPAPTGVHKRALMLLICVRASR
jgi:hypothetical protein